MMDYTMEEIMWDEMIKDKVDDFGKKIDRIISDYALDDEAIWALIMERLRESWVPY